MAIAIAPRDELVDALQEMEITTDDLDPHLQRLLMKKSANHYQTAIEDGAAGVQP